MSPRRLRKKLMRDAAYYETLPQHVVNDLLGHFRRQDREVYELLRSCFKELRQGKKNAS